MILVLDLDDTLYPEATFVESGFAAVAEFLAPRLDASPDLLRARLNDLVVTDGRGRTFDTLMAEYGNHDRSLVDECVRVYRSHDPQINLYPGVREMLTRLKDLPLYLVTDGDPDVQARKIEALAIAPDFRACYRTWSFGRDAGKPSLACFEMILTREDADWADVVYVGDDPAKDFVSLNTVGAGTVRVHSGRFAHVGAAPGFDAQRHVQSVVEIPDLLGL